MVEALTRRISQTRIRSISFSKRPKLRKRSISDSNLLLDSQIFSNERLRSFTTVSNDRENVGRLRKLSTSEINLHHVNIIYGKPDASVSNRNTRCLGIRENEEGDGAEDNQNIVENLRENNRSIVEIHREVDAFREEHDKRSWDDEQDSKRRQNDEKHDERRESEENISERKWSEGDNSGRIISDRELADQRKSGKNTKNKMVPTPAPPSPRKRKSGLTSFSLTKFMSGKIRTRLRSYEPDDPRQLIIAIRNRDINRVRYILEQCPVDVNGCNSKGVTSVHEAALDGQCDIIELLLQYKAQVNQKDKEGMTCLDYAVFGGHFECAAYLIDNGATASSVIDGMPAYFKTNDWL